MFENGNFKKIVLVILAIMLICFGIASFIFVQNGDSFTGIILNKKDNGVLTNYDVNDEKLISLNDIETIETLTASTDINFVLEDRQDIKAHLHGTVKTTNEDSVPYLNTETKGSRIVIETKYKSNFVTIMNSDLKLDIYLPKYYKNNIKASVSSANIDIAGFSLKNLTLSSASGDFTIKNITCDVLEVNQSSGSTNAENIKSKELSFEAASGDLTATNIETEETSINSSSGKINIDSFSGTVNGETASGNITLKYKKFKNNIDISTSSGDVSIDLPDSAEFYLDTDVSSGKISCDFPITIESSDNRSLSGIVKNSDNKIKIETASGDIKIK